MVKSMLLDPRKIELDMKNPRFSLFNFENEKEVIDYLCKYEDVKTLAIQIIKNGYITIGERVIALESLKKGEMKYTALEGNRRIAALKIIFTETNRFSSADREKIRKLDVKDFFVACDIVDEKEEDESRYKITAKHIDGIKAWNPTDKRVFYDNLYTQYRKNGISSEKALKAIEKVTPETQTKIKNALRKHRFLSMIYNETKIIHPKLSYLSHLDSDVLTSRVQQRIKETLKLVEDDDFYLKCRDGKEAEFKAILKSLGEATWVNKTLNTRTFSTQNMWEDILEKDIVIPGLSEYIKLYFLTQESCEETAPETDKVSETDESGSSQIIPTHNTNEAGKNTSPQMGGKPDFKEESDNQEDTHKKYKMFVSNQSIEIESWGYELTQNIDILDEKSNHISKNSSIFQNIIFWSEDNNIAIKGKQILDVSENGRYTIKVKFFDIEKSYSVFLKIPRQRKQQEDYKDLFSDKWFDDSVALLSSKDEYSNLIAVLNCLSENKDISKKSDNLVMLSFLIRILIEYSSKAYWDKYRSNSKKPANLITYISYISTDLFQKKIICLEEKKSFSNGNDLETLNGQIHDYKSNISTISIETIFKSYKVYLDKLFLELNK
ncbi:hypothetical protein [Listeria innocua]|uniref:hypothetical protein n=1 Tax=Listeria innocua TaxID=1642 RepID=UPI00086B6608|nr:hypothetical protein [Listeria innocua]OEO39053.1 hypothetical protein AJU45_05130 [Listeria monocytogenes]MBC1439463.1 hypothetical protein [Listeria innocua]MDG0896953.1 hypothetical protein [Listeria innocua]MDH4593605.1 hypothetical protein [Listeria innocua]UVW26663.1 hypothetical protein NVV71_14480 [Listeria innocua]